MPAAITEEGFDPQYGARLLRRVIQHRFENPLAAELLRLGESDEDKMLTVDHDGSDFVFSDEVFPFGFDQKASV